MNNENATKINLEMETCILCGKTLNTPKDMHISARRHYIEGAGQVCHECFVETYGKNLKKGENY